MPSIWPTYFIEVRPMLIQNIELTLKQREMFPRLQNSQHFILFCFVYSLDILTLFRLFFSKLNSNALVYSLSCGCI